MFGKHEIRWVLDNKNSKPETRRLQVLVGNQEWQDVETVILSKEGKENGDTG